MSCDFIHEFFKGSGYRCSSISPNRSLGVSVQDLDDELIPPVYIIATRQGWAIDSSGIGFSVDVYCQDYSIEEACSIVKGVLNSEHLPIKPEDIEISVLRSQGIASQSIKHKPTGVTKWIKDAIATGAIVNKQKEEAYHHIVLELAEISLHNK